MSKMLDDLKRIASQIADERASNPERTDLEDLIMAQFAWSPETGAAARKLTEAILAAGYRMPRIITTAEELDALPAKSAILDQNGTPWVGDGDNVEPWASVCEDPYGGPIWKNSIGILLPATVLHEPEPQP